MEEIVRLYKNSPEDSLVYVVKDIEGNETTKRMPIHNADGSINKDLQPIMDAYLEKGNNEKSSDLDEIIKTKKHKIVKEEKASSKLDTAIKVAAGAIAATTISLFILACRGCGKEDKADVQVIPSTSIESEMDNYSEPEEQVDEYVPMNKQQFNTMVTDFIAYLAKYNLTIDAKDAEKYIAVANIDTIFEDDKELANELFSGKDYVELMTDILKVNSIISQHNATSFHAVAENETGAKDLTQEEVDNYFANDYISVSPFVYDAIDSKKIKVLDDFNVQLATEYAKEDYSEEKVNILTQEIIDTVNNANHGWIFSDGTVSTARLEDGPGMVAYSSMKWVNSCLFNATSQEMKDGIEIISNSSVYLPGIKKAIEGCNPINEMEESNSYVR